MGVASADATQALAESGVSKRQARSQGPKKQRGLRASFARNRVCLFGWKALDMR